MNRDFKGVWIPKQIWLNKDLTIMEKLFLVEIDSLDNENGCFASNAHFSEMFELSKGRCTQIIKSLEAKQYIKIELQREGKVISKRILRVVNKINTLFNKLNTPIKNIKQGYLENAQGNNTLTNNTKGRNETCAFSFLESNYSSRLETQILMRYKSQIKDFKKFIEQYNNTVDIEDLEWKPNILFGRLNKFAINWVSNQDKYAKPDAEAQPTYLRKTL